MRRFYVAQLRCGSVALDARQSRHAARVLRLRPGAAVRLFDGSGREGTGRIETASPACVVVAVERIETVAEPTGPSMACALPKGKRADFMVEKLSELGVATLQPVRFSRGVRSASPAALRRFRRIATESAKQCGRAGVMAVPDPIAPAALDAGRCIVADPDAAHPLRSAVGNGGIMVIGPEGGLTPGESERFQAAQARFVTLAPTVLRVETAAIVAAAILISCGGD